MNALQCRVEEERRSIHMPINDDILFVAMLDVKPSILPIVLYMPAWLVDVIDIHGLRYGYCTLRCFTVLIFTTSSYFVGSSW